jgi:arginase family enzyme
VTAVERDSIAIIGFPYDESMRKTTGRAGSSVTPKAIRSILRKSGAGSLFNPEFGVDISEVAIYDVGDIAPGLPFEEAYARLVSTVAEVVRRGGLPFVLGGSSELCCGVATGVMVVAGGSIGVVSVNSQLDVRQVADSDNKVLSGHTYRQLLDDPRFCMSRRGSCLACSCEGKFVVFAAQVPI